MANSEKFDAKYKEHLVRKILDLKEKRGALIVAHNYQRDEIQEIADLTGDSFKLASEVKAAKEKGIGISLCGEIAGDPFYTLLLLGLGIRELSMSVSSVPLLKKVIRSLSMEEAGASLDRILELTTAGDVKNFLDETMDLLVPEFKEKDFYMKIAVDNNTN